MTSHTTNPLLEATRLLDYDHPKIKQLVAARGWEKLNDDEKIRAIYTFVKDEIHFGYNKADTLPASKVLKDGLGQCNTKTTLLMTLLRAVGIPCRFHGFTVDKTVQEGILSGIWYNLAPQEILHSWTEVQINDQWVPLEGVILDDNYLEQLRDKFNDKDTVCGFGAASNVFHETTEKFNGEPTYIQSKAIVKDYGVFSNPDEFYKEHHQKLPFWKEWLFKHLVRNIMNSNVSKIRKGI